MIQSPAVAASQADFRMIVVDFKVYNNLHHNNK